MRSLRHVLLVVFFLALVALEIAHGAYRLATIRERQYLSLLDAIEREQRDLARSIEAGLLKEREHCAYLARLPAALRVTGGGAPALEARREVERLLLPYLIAFRGIDRVRILDSDGREQLRCERIGQGVGCLPESLRAAEADAAALDLDRGLKLGEVAMSDIVEDAQRVEVSLSLRQVVHYATEIRNGERRAGLLVLTTYAADLLERVRRFVPLAGATSALVDDSGRYLSRSDAERGQSSTGARGTLGELGAAPDWLSGDANRLSTGAGVFLRSPASASPPWHLVSHIPASAIDAAAAPARGETLWILGSVAAVTCVLAAAAFFLLRLSIREVRLREARQRQDIEKRLQLAERLNSLGLLTAGVAHEINNPLEGIGNYLALLERQALPEEKRARYLELVRHGFNRIRDIVRDLSAFARPSLAEGTADLSEVVHRAVRLCAYTQDFKEIAVQTEGLDAPLWVRGDPNRIEQVLLNLLLNAAKAMSGKGRVTVRARGAPGDGRVEVEVEDNGPGIPPEHADKIFDPFFSGSGGTGLGLSISYRIVEAHGSQLLADNHPGGGARFRFSLRAAAAPASAVRDTMSTA
jgi:signal transduction histidine kinase